MPETAHPLHVAPTPSAQGVAGSAATPGRARHWLAALVYEPVFHFALLGFLTWSGVEYWNSQNSRYTIDVGSADRERIATTYLQQFGQAPAPDQLEILINRHIREEIFLREGLALNLDQNDEIVRRRIVQKYEFLQTDLAVADAPASAVLQGWFEQHQQRYLIPPRSAFSHVYFSADQEGERAAWARAVKMLEKLRAMDVARAPDLGDAFPGPSDVSALAPEEAARIFGHSELSDELFKLPVGQWTDPLRSGYGWHLIYVTERRPAVLPPLSEIQPQVLADYQEEQRRLLNARAFEKLRAKYTVRYDGERQ